MAKPKVKLHRVTNRGVILPSCTVSSGTSQGLIKTRDGNLVLKKTTSGWEFLVEFKDGSSNWIHLKKPKQSNPEELDKYAASNGLLRKYEFKLWVKDVLEKLDHIVEKLKSKYRHTSNNFGIKPPKMYMRHMIMIRIQRKLHGGIL